MDGNEMAKKTPDKQPNNNRYPNLRGPRWKKGESGNPAGRPKKEKLLEPLIRELLESKVLDGPHKGKEWKRLVAEALVRNLIKGNAAAIKEILQRIDGPVVQEVGGPDGEPVEIHVTYGKS